MNKSERKGENEPSEDESVELKMRDAFGKIQYINALPRKKILEKIGEVDENLYDYIKKAWENHISGAVDTDVVVDLETGEIDYANYEPNSGPIFDPSITLFTISHRTSADTSSEDLYTPDELEEIKEMKYKGEIEEHEEYAEKKGIDLDERYIENIAGYIREDELGFDFLHLFGEVKRIYENEVKN